MIEDPRKKLVHKLIFGFFQHANKVGVQDELNVDRLWPLPLNIIFGMFMLVDEMLEFLIIEFFAVIEEVGLFSEQPIETRRHYTPVRFFP